MPLTDLSLVRGDKLPLRVSLLDDGTPVTPSGTRPALAVKTALGDDTLVLAATNLEPVDDALGAAYVGSLSVNTTQLVAAMGVPRASTWSESWSSWPETDPSAPRR